MATFQDIVNANKLVTTTNVKGKDYAMVHQRVKAFRSVYPNGGIVTDLISDDGKVCVMRTTIYDEEGKVLGTGMAFERADSSMVNKTSYIENCETSSCGRALGFCGFGIDQSIASADEVQRAIEQQEKQKAQENELSGIKKEIVQKCKDLIAAGMVKEVIYKAIADVNNGNQNPNAATDLETCNQILNAINSLEKPKTKTRRTTKKSTTTEEDN